MRLLQAAIIIVACSGCGSTQFLNSVGNPKKPANPDEFCGVWSYTDPPGAQGFYLHVEKKADDTVEFLTVEHRKAMKPGGIVVSELGSGFLAKVGDDNFLNARDPISLNYCIYRVKVEGAALTVTPISDEEVVAAIKSSRLKGKNAAGDQTVVEDSRSNLIKFLKKSELSELFPEKDALHYKKID